KERPGEQYPRGAGLFSYAPAAAEFVRSCYQDYLGIGVDGISGTLSLKPKLPDHLTEVDCTVFVGDVPVNVQYQIGQAVSRIVLEQAEASEELKVTFIWTMKSGNGWRGSLKLPGSGVLRIVFSEDDVVGFHGDESVAVTGKWHLKGFSRREEFTDLHFAVAPTP
ncbi:MAG: hypothetical protein KAJ12_03300, partial [Bacteroidetes bacterium]|nr:hypothetical protein [Bacteroidota bacterium]